MLTSFPISRIHSLQMVRPRPQVRRRPQLRHYFDTVEAEPCILVPTFLEPIGIIRCRVIPTNCGDSIVGEVNLIGQIMNVEHDLLVDGPPLDRKLCWVEGRHLRPFIPDAGRQPWPTGETALWRPVALKAAVKAAQTLPKHAQIGSGGSKQKAIRSQVLGGLCSFVFSSGL